MLKNRLKVIGVMSGTSLDGIDIIECDFAYNDSWSFITGQHNTISYSKEWHDRLKNIAQLDGWQLSELDKDYTQLLGNEIKRFIESNGISEIDFVSSHGHTAKHVPEQGMTYQIGNLDSIADILEHEVICDFRVQDLSLGGQGAPLVPIGDLKLFANYDYCLNLGGFSNISFDDQGKRVAFDICPVNIVLNHYAAKKGLDYDKDGALALQGHLNSDLLSQLNDLEFFNLKWPKSLGVEWVTSTVLPLIESFNLGVEDVLATYVEHIAIQISSNLKSDTKVLITGGGAYNVFLIERLRHHTAAELVIPNDDIVNFKEAIIFAFLGVLRSRNEINCLKSVTGALIDHSSGLIHQPKSKIT